MCNFQYMVQFISLFLICFVQCEFSNDSDIDQCKDVCADSFFLLPKNKEAQDICQRGCRFFNIIYLKDDHGLNITKEECYLSCEEAYVNEEPKSACSTGCKAMSKKKESERPSAHIFVEQDSQNMIIVEPELDLSDILSDPLIQSQIEIGYNIEYKIPETKIRTMPIEIEVGIIIPQKQATGDWLDCASRNSGIPKWILLTAILSAILVALWLSISSEKRVINDELLDDTCLIKDEDDSDCEIIESSLPEKDPNLLDCVFEREVDFSSPPQYTIETEKV